ncbi:hypothetical protein MRB53_002258 [Persea americana]|uniref:Uncharacterized protein n=1 Tax=Persea americana TaxID=3435 RepID=A0ACC2MUX9_PERAE|nr:hypothetical protein MRB53_002258 [Persea americana]
MVKGGVGILNLTEAAAHRRSAGVVGPRAVSRRLADLRKKLKSSILLISRSAVGRLVGQPTSTRRPAARPSCLTPLFWCLDAGAVAIAEERPEEAFEPPPAREWQPDDVL